MGVDWTDTDGPGSISSTSIQPRIRSVIMVYPAAVVKFLGSNPGGWLCRTSANQPDNNNNNGPAVDERRGGIRGAYELTGLRAYRHDSLLCHPNLSRLLQELVLPRLGRGYDEQREIPTIQRETKHTYPRTAPSA